MAESQASEHAAVRLKTRWGVLLTPEQYRQFVAMLSSEEGRATLNVRVQTADRCKGRPYELLLVDLASLVGSPLPRPAQVLRSLKDGGLLTALGAQMFGCKVSLRGCGSQSHHVKCRRRRSRHHPEYVPNRAARRRQAEEELS